MTADAARRYVLSKRTAGLGDGLVSLLAAWRFARATERVLVADWRGSAYAARPGANAFAAFFEAADTLADVPFVGHERLDALDLPRPLFPAIWDVLGPDHPMPRGGKTERERRDQALALVASGRDVVAPTVVFDGCLHGAEPDRLTCRRVLADLVPVAAVREAVARFRAAHLAGRPVVGVHIRHGNGGDIMGHRRFWHVEPAALAMCELAARQAAARLGDATVLLCTDSARVEAAFRQAWPSVVTRPKVFREEGAGELHRWRHADRGAQDALIEMLLLQESDVLVRFPPGSYFTVLPSLGRRGAASGAPVVTYPSGPLGPAVEW